MGSPYWMSVEVVDGATGASGWSDAYGETLVGTALRSGAVDWAWHTSSWSVIFEVAFADEAAWHRFRADPAVAAVLDDVPDPLSGLIVYRGRGGGSATRQPRKPRPRSGSGAAALPLPVDDDLIDLAALLRRGSVRLLHR